MSIPLSSLIPVFAPGTEPPDPSNPTLIQGKLEASAELEASLPEVQVLIALVVVKELKKNLQFVCIVVPVDWSLTEMGIQPLIC